MGIDQGQQQLGFDGFVVEPLGPNELEVEKAKAEVDDDAWGVLPVVEVQRRLEEADDFAIVVLQATLSVKAPLTGLFLEATAEGQRNLSFGKTYLVPAKAGAAKDYCRYVMPSPLAVGEHLVTWSYAWHPPKDRDTGEAKTGGVTLRPLRVVGDFSWDESGLGARGPLVDLGRGAWHHGPARFKKTIDIAPGQTRLRIEGNEVYSLRADLDGVELVRREDQPGLFALPPGVLGAAELTLHSDRGFLRLSTLQLIR